MPRLDTHSFIAPMLDRGLSSTEAQKIVDQALSSGKLDLSAKQKLVEISEVYSSFFTKSGAAKWKKLTGIVVGGPRVVYPEGFLPRQTLLDLRATLQTRVPETKAAFEVERSRSGSVTVTERSADLPAAAPSAWVGRKVTPKVARDLKVSSPFLEEYLAANPDSPALAALFEDIAEIERNEGNNDGYLVVRDLDDASATVRGVMDRVWKLEGGARRIALSRIRRRLPRAAVQFLNYRCERGDPQHTVYANLVREAVAWLAEGYQTEVIEGGMRSEAYFKSRGFSDDRCQRRARQLIPELWAKPTEEEAAALWQMKLDGKIHSVRFREIAQMSVAEGEALEKKRPELFEKKKTGRTAADPISHYGSQEEAIGEFLDLIASYRKEDILISRNNIIKKTNRNEAFVEKWGGMTTARYKTWQRAVEKKGLEHLTFPDLRSVDEWIPVLTAEIKALLAKSPGLTMDQVRKALKPRHPSISKHHVETVGTANPGLFQKGRRSPDRKVEAAIVAERAQRWAEEDVLITRDDIISRMNEDEAFVAEFGELTPGLYKNIGRYTDFPRLRDRSVWMPVIMAEVEELLKRDNTLSYSDLARALEPKHPRINESTIGELGKDKKYKPIFEKYRGTTEKRDYKKVARRIATILEKAPATKFGVVAKQLKPDYPWLTERLVSDMVNRYRAELFPQVRAARNQTADIARKSLVVDGLWDTVLRLFPPGTTQDVTMGALNQLLEKRGVPAYTSKVFQQQFGSSLDAFAEVGARVVAEYAKVAPKGASENDILNAVADDYPGMTRMGMRHIKMRWLEDPKSFPELAPFIKGVRNPKLELRGLGETMDNPRYVGGWSIERSVLGGGKQELHKLAETVQHTRIPLHLPMLDLALDDLNGSTPLQSKNVLMVSHVLATTVPFALALKQAGLEYPNTVMVGTPYGSNETAVGTLRDMGFDLRVPELSVKAYRQQVEQALDDIIKRYRENGQTIVVLDDGGLVADLLHEKEKYRDILDAGVVKIVEQTTGGLIQNDENALRVPIIDVPASLSKKKEGRMVGRAVATKVRTGLEGLGQELPGKRAVVWGYGVVGREVARELRDAGVEVTVIETSDKRRLRARVDGYAVAAKATRYLSKADVFIGCTGEQVMTVDDMRKLKSGAVFASASSKQNEFDMEGLADSASAVSDIEPATPVITLPNREYELGGKRIIALGDGWPINFDGDVEDIPPGEIQLTRAIMFSAAMQACSLLPTQKNIGLIKLDPDEDRKLLERYEQFRTSTAGAHPLRDPFAWRTVVHDLAAELGALDTPEVARSMERAKARYLEPKLWEWYNADPIVNIPDVVKRVNADEEFVARFGEITHNQYTNLSKHIDMPNLNSLGWMPILLAEVKELMAEDETYTRKDLRTLLKPRHPKLKKYHIDRLGLEYPDIVPNSRPDLRRS